MDLFPKIYSTRKKDNDKEKKRKEAEKKLISERQATRKTNAEKGTSLARLTTNEAIQYNKDGFKGRSGDKGTTSYEWEKNILHDLPSKYGKSYNAKFDTWAKKDLGLGSQEANEFRTWLDSKEDVIKTRKRSNQEGYKELPIASKNAQLKDMLKNQGETAKARNKAFYEDVEWDTSKWEEEEAKKAEQKEKTDKKAKRSETERDGVFGFLDRTVGRFGRSAHDMAGNALGMPDFADEQDKAFRRTAEANNNTKSLKQLNTVTRKADGALEKAADIAGAGAGILGLALPYGAAYKAVGAAGNLARLTKGGAQAAEVLSKSRVATEALRGSAAGFTFGAANAGAREAIDPTAYTATDHWKRIGIETALGGVGDVAVMGVGRGLGALKNNVMDARNMRSGAYNNRAEIGITPYTEKPSQGAMDALTQGQSSLVNSEARNITKNVRTSKITSILDEMKAARQTGASSPLPEATFTKRMEDAIASQREQAIEAQFKYLKQNMTKGTEGGTTTNLFGEIDGTFNVSKNEGWYQQIYKQNGDRPPSQKQLKELAVKHVDEGFIDSVGEIPAWRPAELDIKEMEIAQYTKAIAENPEQTPAILPLLQAAESDYTELLANFNKIKGVEAPPQLEIPQVQNVPENMNMSQTPSMGVNRAINPSEGILSQNQIPPQNTAITEQINSIVNQQRNVSSQFDNLQSNVVRQEQPSDIKRMTRDTIPLRQPNPNAKVKPITERSLVENMEKRFNVPIRQGRMNTPDNVAGIYKGKVTEVRSKKTNDIPVIAHEIGHHLDKKFNLTKNLGTQYDNELISLGSKTSGSGYTTEQIREEGLAEFIRLRVSDKEAAKKLAPKFYQMFEGRLDKKSMKAINETADDIDRWIDQGYTKQLSGKIERAGKPKSGKNFIEETYTQLVDSQHALTKMELDLDGKEFRGLLGGKHKELNSAEKSIAKTARLSLGAPKKAQTHLDDFKKIVSKAEKNGVTYNDIGDYSTARHAKELEFMGVRVGKEAVDEAKLLSDELSGLTDANKILEKVNSFAKKYGVTLTKEQQTAAVTGKNFSFNSKQLKKIVDDNHIETGMTQKQIRETLKKWDKNPTMKQSHEGLMKYNDGLLTMLRDEGFITKENYTLMREKYPDYMPFFRFFDEDLGGLSGASKGFVDLSNPVKRMKGSSRNIVDPMESVVKNTFSVINQIEKNKVGKQLARLAELEDSAKWVVKLDGKESVSNENIVTVWNNGEKSQYQVDKDVYRALKALDDDSANTFIQLLSKPASWLRAGATLTPEFAIRNPIRDQISAMINSDSGYNPIDFAKGLASVISGKRGGKGKSAQHYKDWVKQGGGYGGYLSQDRDYLQEITKEISKSNAFSQKAVRFVNPKVWAEKTLKGLQLVSELTEEATKVGEFRKALKKGATPEEAAFRSRDLMDFGRSGTSVKQTNRIISFLNANIQGKDKLARSFAKHPMRSLTRSLIYVTMPTIGAYQMREQYSNDKQKEAYENVPQWQKDSFWILPILGTDELARIPKPFDLAPIFANPTELAMDYMKENDPEEFKKFLTRNAVSVASLPLTISALAPTIENITNYDFFTQTSVVPERDKDQLPEDQYGANTSFVARAGGKLTKTSPYKWDNMIQGHFAGLGGYVMDGVDAIARKTDAGEKLGMSTPAETKWSEKPVIKAFTVDQRASGQIMTNFYDTLDKMKVEEKRATKDGSSYRNENKLKKLEDLQKDISEIRKEYREVQSNTKMDGVRKRKELDKLNGDMQRLAKRGISEAK